MLKDIIKKRNSVHRKRDKSLGLLELVAIALGGMVGGGIFTVLGISVSMIGAYTPFAILLGGILAALAAYSYVKLGVYYKDEGATYSFFKRSYPGSTFKAALIGWWVVFGYISTIALYAYTFSTYSLSATEFSHSPIVQKLVASLVILLFCSINIWSVKGMGKLEDVMVYTKLVLLCIISFTFLNHAEFSLPVLLQKEDSFSLFSVLVVSSITFVAYEGFQLVINAVGEMEKPEKNIPRAIYTAIALAVGIYILISWGAITTIPFEAIIKDKEFALAAGAESIIGKLGKELVILGAILATSSAISGTLFGSSRQMAVVARDGFMPKFLSERKEQGPVNAILAMSFLASILIWSGNLEMILEFGSVTFLLVSLLMAFANHKLRVQTKSSSFLTLLGVLGLSLGTGFIFYYEFTHAKKQLLFILALYALLTLGSWVYSKKRDSGQNH